MKKSLHNKYFPNESEAYREARNELLKEEIELRRKTEEVAKLRRILPLGGKLKENYVFKEAANKEVVFFELFAKGKNTLVIYNMMYSPDWDEPCNMCYSIVDGLNGNARQINQKINLVVTSKAPIEKLHNLAKKAGWTHLNILSSYDNTYEVDYLCKHDDNFMPMLNVFIKKNGEIYHTWGSELSYTSADPGEDERPIDGIWPLWNVFDLTPEGREDWYPEITY